MSLRDPGRTCLVTGASRGLGLELVRQYVADGWVVHACARDPANGPLADAIAASNGNIVPHVLDMMDPEGPARLAHDLRGMSLDLLVNNAGVYGPPVQDLSGVDQQAWLDAFTVNSIAPVRLTLAFLPYLTKVKGKVVTITSRMGSIGDMMAGGYYAYRATKAAVNASLRAVSIDVAAQNVTSVVMHPGWVRTDMGGKEAPLSPKESVTAMRKVIASVTLSDTGKFFNYDGEILPW